MTRKFIPVEESFRAWDKDPEFRAAYGALEEEFALASTLIEAHSKADTTCSWVMSALLIEARSTADRTQEQVAQAMGTTQGVIARLESGRTMPSTRTLQRYAKATGTRLRIQLEPEKPGRPAHP